MRYNGTPPRFRGERANEISKALTQLLRHTAPRQGISVAEDGYVELGDLLQTPRLWRQWITAAEVIDVVRNNHKCRFEVRFQNASYQVRAFEGHSIPHVKDELVLTQLSAQEIPEYCAHGTYYDFYESILRMALMAGGQQGKTTRKHVHLHDGPISGMRSDCDLVIWIKTREAAASGLIFFRSANDVILTEETIATCRRSFSSERAPPNKSRTWVSPGEGDEDDPDLQVAVASASSSKQSWSSLHTQSLISRAVPI